MGITQDFFDSYAYDFDALYGAPQNILSSVINPLFRKSMKLRFEKTIEYTAPVDGKTILDIGCGPGHYAVALSKAGAKNLVGIDFAPEMIKIAKEKSQVTGVASVCTFLVTDIFEFQSDFKFDYAILMGFMDYISDPKKLIEKVITLTQNKIFFSFPADSGILAAQRKLRYKKRCPLFMYSREKLIDLFSQFDNAQYTIERISRDFFVTLSLKGDKFHEEHNFN